MAEISNPMINPITGQDPEYLRKVLQLQQRQKVAQALQQQSMTPIDYDPRGRISPWQGAAKLAQALLGGSGINSSINEQASLQSDGMKKMAQAYGAAAPSPTTPAASQASASPNNTALANALAPAPEGSQPQPSMQLPAQQFGGNATPLNPHGLNPTLMLMAANGDPVAKMQVENELKRFELTGEQKNSCDPLIGRATIDNLEVSGMTNVQKLLRAQSQVPQGSPQWDALQAAIQKEGAQAVKQGELLMYGNKPMAYNPETDNGMIPTFGNVNGAMMPTGAHALPGYAQGSASIAGAEQRAKTDNSVFTGVQTPGGGTVSGYGGALFGQGAQGGQPQAAPQQGAGVGPGYAGGSAQAAAPGQREILLQELARAQAQGNTGDVAALQRELGRLPGGAQGAGRSAQPGVISGPSNSDIAIQKGAADPIISAPQLVATSKQSLTGLENAMRALEGVRATGPGTAKTNEVLAILNNAGWGIGGKGVNDYQSAQKYLSNALAQAAQGTGSAGSDARFEQFMHGQPNGETLNLDALRGAIRYVQSQHDAAVAKGEYLPKAYAEAQRRGDPNAALTAQQQWSSQYRPEMFNFNRMSKQEQAEFLRSQGIENAKKFVQQYNQYAGQTGWVR